MKRIGKFYFGWGEPDRKVTPSGDAITIVCRSQEEAKRLREISDIGRMKRVNFISPTLTNLGSRSLSNVIIRQEVDVNQDVGGAGRLIDLIKSRQAMFPDFSVLIRL